MHEVQPHLLNRGWFVASLVSTLSFTAQSAWLFEDWSIVADALMDEVLIELNLDREALTGRTHLNATETIDVHGAEVVPELWAPSVTGRQVIGIRLPDPLEPQQSHHFQLRVQVPQAGRIDHHLCLPVVRCQRLRVRVHFDKAAIPARVRPVIADRPTMARGSGPFTGVPVNAVGEVAMAFEDLAPRQAYGLTWLVPHLPGEPLPAGEER